MSQYSSTRYLWQSTSGVTPLTTNSSTTIVAAATSTDYNGNTIKQCNYLTDLVLSNTSTTTGTAVSILDGSNIVYTVYAPNVPSGTQVAPVIINLSTPVKSSQGNALSLKCNTTGASIYWSASGFTAGV